MEKYLQKKYQKETKTSMQEMLDEASKYDDVISFSVGDPDLKTDSRIIELMSKDVLNGYTHYTNPSGDLRLKDAIVKENKEDYDIKISSEQVFIATSASHGLFLSLSSIIEQDDEVIVFSPYFSSYKSQIEMLNGKMVEVPLYLEDNFQIRMDLFEKSITSKTKAVIINTPSNPTGKCYSFETLEKLSKIIVKYDLIAISDEIYTIFSYSSDFIPLVKMPNMMNRTITIRSFSKDYCMTGFRIGYIFANQRIIEAISYINDGVVYSAPSPSQSAAFYAIKYRHEIRSNIRREFKKRIDYAYNRLLKISFLEPVKPDGTIYIFVDIRKSKMSSIEFCRWFLKKYHLLVLPGSIFGTYGEGFVRFAVTQTIDKMQEAFDRII